MENKPTKIILSIAAIALAGPVSQASLVVDGNLTVEEVTHASDGVVFYGTFNGASSIPATGVGTRLMWYPKKAAFRAGHVTGTHWDDGSVGDYSVALGYNSSASGEFSFAQGEGSGAHGKHAISMGASFTQGEGSIGIGSGNVSFGGDQNIKIGTGNYLDFVDNAVAIGTGNVSVSGAGGAMVGRFNEVYGNDAVAIGRSVVSTSMSLVALGRYNKTGSDWTHSAFTFVDTDPLFVIGNGEGPGWQDRSDAVVVYKNADAHMQGAVRVFPSGDISMGAFTNGVSPDQAPQ